MYKLDQVSADSGKSHCLTRVLLKELFFCLFLKHLSAFKTDICLCTTLVKNLTGSLRIFKD